MSKKNHAFTLLETSVVLLIISAIIASVVIGQKVLHRSKLESVMRDVSVMTTAVTKFRDIYGSMPGDLPTATTQITSKCINFANGNGNNIIDSLSEQMQFWCHIYSADLIPYRTVADYPPVYQTARNRQGNLYPSEFDYTGYLTEYIAPTTTSGSSGTPPAGHVFHLLKSINFTSTVGALYLEDASTLDLKFDDGGGNSGKILASNDDPTYQCHNNGIYSNISATNNVPIPACGLKFLFLPEVPLKSSYTFSTCNGSPIGTTRPSDSAVCPVGTKGWIVQMCTSDGTWKDVSSACYPNICEGGYYPTNFRSVTCPFGFRGTVRQICSYDGLWIDELNYNGTYSSFATFCTYYFGNQADTTPCANLPTSPTGANARGLACGIMQYSTKALGYINQTCNLNVWRQPLASPCQDVTCATSPAFIFIGQRNNLNTGLCPTGFKLAPGQTSAQIQVCTLGATPSPTGVYRTAGHNCVLDYAASCTANSTRTLSCPPGETSITGGVSQTCNASGRWEVTSYGCRPITCGGYAIGSVREAAGQKCPAYNSTIGDDGIGVVLEICNENGVWITSTANCIQ